MNSTTPYHIELHAHWFYEILYILRGARRIKLPQGTHTARSGDLIVFRPYEKHEEFSASKSISYITVRFPQEQLHKAGLRFPSSDSLPTVVHLPNRQQFTGLMDRIIREKENPQKDSQLLLGMYLLEFIVLLRRAVSDARVAGGARRAEGMDRIGAAIELIRQELNQPVQLDEIARYAFMSTSHFSHEFKKRTGASPKAYIINERIEKAKTLLTHTRLSASEIAFKIGYDSPAYFFRQFKSKTGYTAARYRKLHSAEK